MLNENKGYFQLHPSSFEVVSFFDSSRIQCEVGADIVASNGAPRPILYSIKGDVLSIMQTDS
jgi:hypothetical protein